MIIFYNETLQIAQNYCLTREMEVFSSDNRRFLDCYVIITVMVWDLFRIFTFRYILVSFMFTLHFNEFYLLCYRCTQPIFKLMLALFLVFFYNQFGLACYLPRCHQLALSCLHVTTCSPFLIHSPAFTHLITLSRIHILGFLYSSLNPYQYDLLWFWTGPFVSSALVFFFFV